MIKIKDSQTLSWEEYMKQIKTITADKELPDIIKRLDAMILSRQPFDKEWDLCDEQFNAVVFKDGYTGDWVLNTKMEQNLIEMDTGRTSDSLIYDVMPDGYDANADQLERNRYALEYFSDKEDFYREYSLWRQDKSRYWTGIWDCTLKYEYEKMYSVADTSLEAEFWDGYFSQPNLNELHIEKWFFMPKNMNIRHLYIDDRALWQPDFKKAEDCVSVELHTEDEFRELYSRIPWVDQDAVKIAQPITSEDSVRWGMSWVTGHIVVYKYYNKVTKDYVIFANKKDELYSGKLLYKFGWLPFDLCQHYPDSQCLYGRGIPNKVRSERFYKNNLTNYLMRGAKLASTKVLKGSKGTSFVDWFPTLYAWEVNMLEFTSSIEGVWEIDTRIDLNGILIGLQETNNMVRENTGIDMQAPFEARTDTLWQTEILEENKSIRYQAVDEQMYFSLDRCLTKWLCNVQMFAPRVLAVHEEVEDGVMVKKRPKIQLKNVKIDKRKKTIEEDFGNYWYLELSPETMDWDMTVRVITPKTYNRILSVIDKNKASELVKNMTELLNVASVLWPDAVQEITDAFPLEKVVEKLKHAHWYDDSQFVADTKKSKQKKKNKKLIDMILAKTNANVESNTQGLQGVLWESTGTEGSDAQEWWAPTGLEGLSEWVQPNDTSIFG